MLSCIVGNKSVNSFDYEEHKLREWSNKKILRCPECGERVIYCNGDYKIAYFKHEVASECKGNLYSEPITEEHIGGIKSIYNKLKTIQGITNLEVEKYIVNTKQRPDIYFEYKGQRYCIEYQCSPIATQYNKRHELYELEGIKDIWILGTNKYCFEKYEEFKDYISFNEKNLKTIEDEIDKGIMSLLYFNEKDKVIYKINKEGFRPILRSEWKNFKNNKPLKRIVALTLEKIKINDISIDLLLQKENMTIDTIREITKDTICKFESEFKRINDTYNMDYKLKYNLLTDRFPMYKYWFPTCGYRLVYNDIQCKIAEEDICKLEKILEDRSKNKINDNKKTFNDMDEGIKEINKSKIDKMVFKINEENTNYTTKYIYDFDSIYVHKWNSVWNKKISYIQVIRKHDNVKLVERFEVDVKNKNIDIEELYKYIKNKIEEDSSIYKIHKKIKPIINKIASCINKGVSIKILHNNITIMNDRDNDLCTYVHFEGKNIRFIRYYRNENRLNRDEKIKKYTDNNFCNVFKNMVHDEIRRVRYGGNI